MPTRREQELEDRVTHLEGELEQLNDQGAGSATAGRRVEYRSKTMIGRLPLVHVCMGGQAQGGRPGIAKGIIAIGDIAFGVIALGGVAGGGLTLGGVSFGLLSVGGLSIGILLAIGGCAIGGIAAGGFAVGFIAVGGAAVGYIALGDWVAGPYAVRGAGASNLSYIIRTILGLLKELP